jgi:transposase
LAPSREAITGLVVESTYNWYWLVDALMDAGYRVHLANTAAIAQYSGLKYSDDDDFCQGFLPAWHHKKGVRFS